MKWHMLDSISEPFSRFGGVYNILCMLAGRIIILYAYNFDRWAGGAIECVW